jgi:hypothetical protein
MFGRPLDNNELYKLSPPEGSSFHKPIDNPRTDVSRLYKVRNTAVRQLIQLLQSRQSAPSYIARLICTVKTLQ